MGKALGWFFAIIIGVSVLGLAAKIVLFPLFVAHKATDTAKGVVSKTLNADNAIFNYEKFKDLYNGSKQQVQNINDTQQSIDKLKETYGSPDSWTKDVREQFNFLNQTLEGYKQQYNRTVSDYNSDSSKLNRTLFKDKNLPAELPLDYTQLQ